MENKRHYKMYKAGKRWCAIGLITVVSSLSVMILAASSVHAADQGGQPAVTAATTVQPAAQSQSSQPSNAQQTVQTSVNEGYLDSMQANNGQLTMSGWHVTNQATNLPNHYIIVLANGREVGRTKAITVQRPDVASAVPTVPNAGNSGWQASIRLTTTMIGTNLQVVSRYTSSADGNSNYFDLWYPQRSLGHSKQNQAFLDAYALANGHFQASGWNANDMSVAAPYHFLILFDQTANRQVAVTQVRNTTRNDVARAFPQIRTVANSGFNADLGAVNLNPDHHYALVSRYSTINTGNGDGGAGTYFDYWLNIGQLDRRAYSWVDSITQNGNQIHVNGWLASNQRVTHPYGYLIVLNNGREVSRSRINFIARPDVGRAYPKVQNSAWSGFNQSVTVSPNSLTGTMFVILRLTDDPTGNGNYIDQYTQGYDTNAGWFDNLQVEGNNLHISGWHAAMKASNKPLKVVIITDANGHELYRRQVSTVTRNDVSRHYSWIGDASQSGFDFTVPLTAAMRNKALHVYMRSVDSLANDNNADHYIDWVGKVAPGGGLYYIDSDWYSFARNGKQQGHGIFSDWRSINTGGRNVAIAIQSQVNGQVVSYTNAPGWQGQAASTIKVSVLAMLLHNTGGNLNGTQWNLVTRMIRNSDNDATRTIVNTYLGGNFGLQAIFNALGMTNTHAAEHWGYVLTTPVDQLKLLNQIYLAPNSNYLNQRSRQIIADLMGSVNPSQAWGISAGSPRSYVKNGWNYRDRDENHWFINSIGFIPGSNNDGYTIAVYTYSSPTVGSGAALIEQFARATRKDMF